MKSKNLILLPLLGVIASCLDVTNEKQSLDKYYKERNRSMEITTLIDTLVQGYGLSDWGNLSDAKEIVWKDEGATGKDIYYQANYARNGELYITAGKQFSHFLLGVGKKPVIWEVLLSGSRGGYTNIVLSNSILSHEFDGFGEYFKKNGYLMSSDTIQCPQPYTGCSMVKMKLRIKKREITVLEESAGGGTAGPNISIYFNSEGTDNIKMPPF